MKSQVNKQLFWAWGLTKNYRTRIGLYMLLGMISVACSLTFVYASKHAIDVVTGGVTGNLSLTCCLIVVTMAAGIVVELIASWMCEVMKAQVKVNLQSLLIDAQMMAAWERTKRWHTGDLLVRIREDAAELVQMLVQTLPSLCVTCVKLVASLAFLWFMDQTLALLILAVSPLLFFSKLYYKKMRRLSREVKRAESRLGMVMQENLKHRLLVRALNVAEVRQRRLNEGQEDLYGWKLKQLMFSTGSQLIFRMVFNGGYLLAFLWGVYRLHQGEISFGTMAAFLQLVGRVQSPVLAVVAFVPAAIRSLASADRLMELHHVDRETKECFFKKERITAVSLKDVSFCYEDREVLKDLNVCMRLGEPVAITGSTGKGKTTLVRLLLGLVIPQKGEIYLEAQHQIPVSPATRVNFAYVPQGNSLFNGTIRENLLMVYPDATEHEMREALRLACAEFVYSLPHGPDTLLGESGYGLSEGQAQRIAVARALLQRGDIWLLDEVTSALDAHTAACLTRNLLEAGRDKILIFVTHDSHLMQICKKIIQI